MSDTITASFRWSVDELLTAQGVHLKNSTFGRKLRRTRVIVAPLGIAVGAAILVTKGFNPLGFFVIILAVLFLLFPLFARRMAIKHYASRPDRDRMVSWEFSQDGIVSKTEVSSAKLEWRMLARVLQTKKGFLFYQNEQVFEWVPTHAFRNPADADALADLARSRVKRFDKV